LAQALFFDRFGERCIGETFCEGDTVGELFEQCL
jgi:hypothetical protein